MDLETLQRALIKHFHEAAALVAADIEAQETEADELDGDRVVYANLGNPDEPLEAA